MSKCAGNLQAITARVAKLVVIPRCNRNLTTQFPTRQKINHSLFCFLLHFFSFTDPTGHGALNEVILVTK